ncbi:MFS transporter [Aestuariivirga sp.]|uniref:MFS transporter n=1 Tax=Aestuariivirga sp. TaxID=2650926 RepID=UPI00391B2539
MDAKRLAAALLLCLAFGSIHAYGVLLAPIEEWLGLSRARASLAYSLAIVALTAGVYLNGRLESVATARARLMASGIISAAGLAAAALSSNRLGLLTGFGIMYGLANGIAYACALGLSAEAMHRREARAIGLATAAYGLGAVLFAQVFAAWLFFKGVAGLLLAMSCLLLVSCLAAAALVGQGRTAPDAIARAAADSRFSGVSVLWVVYFLGAFAGLMVIAHAPAIASDLGGGSHAGIVAGVVALGSVVGGYSGGLLAERLSGSRSLALPVLVQAAVLTILPLMTAEAPIIAGLGVTGFCYGMLISAVPAVIRRRWGANGFAGAYGKVFTAWGLAGLAGPVSAGYLFDVTAHYNFALAVAALLSAMSFILVVQNRFGISANRDRGSRAPS